MLGQLTSEQLAGRRPLPHHLQAGRGLNARYLRQLEELPQETRSFLVLASTMSTDDPSRLWRAAEILGLSEESADAAIDSGVLTIADRVTFRHPLIRSAVYDAAEPRHRRFAHTAMAAIAELDDDRDLAAWHRAAAMLAPNEVVAADLERSARRAENRGGRLAQARFLDRAAELSPGPRERGVRLLAAAEAYLAAGDGILAEALVDKAAPWLEDDTRSVDLQRMRASIAVFFLRYKNAPALLLDAVAHVDKGNVELIRSILFDALQAALVARDDTLAETTAGIAKRVLTLPFDTNADNVGRDVLLQALSTQLTVGYASAAPLSKRAVSTLFREDELHPAVLSTVTLGWFAADDLWDDAGRHDMFERAIALGRGHGDLGALRIALAGKCVGQCWTGDIEGAEQTYSEASEVSALIGVPHPATAGVLLELRAWQGREQETRDTAALTADWGAERGAGVLEVNACLGLTVLEMGLGKYESAFESAMRIYDNDPPGFGNRILPEVVEAGARTGRTDTAHRALERLADRALASGSPWALGVLARSRAVLADDTEAQSLYEEAIGLLSQTSVKTDLARAHLVYGQWLRRQRRRKDAQGHLFVAFEMFDSMGASAFAGRAHNELRAAGYHHVDVSGGQVASGLTSQEATVAQLATDGATNSEIATQMFLTTSTVEYHLSKIFRKLGITSRRQLSLALAMAVRANDGGQAAGVPAEGSASDRQRRAAAYVRYGLHS
ncbi:LuxR C-terminal-related transcriptional regulator [Lacisediminihabitans changchengi]|uniref:LuxR C-terminal-related transcriptional regulator n=1 Tax=Lacisediminihabitans changchengi TaxID=2787634 RepID=UPI0027DC5672|nr:LuxR C-terminal-related transcriptional regulator [Lacisediminihabitans changchengi]